MVWPLSRETVLGELCEGGCLILSLNPNWWGRSSAALELDIICGVFAVGDLMIKPQQNIFVMSAGDENILP